MRRLRLAGIIVPGHCDSSDSFHIISRGFESVQLCSAHGNQFPSMNSAHFNTFQPSLAARHHTSPLPLHISACPCQERISQLLYERDNTMAAWGGDKRLIKANAEARVSWQVVHRFEMSCVVRCGRANVRPCTYDPSCGAVVPAPQALLASLSIVSVVRRALSESCSWMP